MYVYTFSPNHVLIAYTGDNSLYFSFSDPMIGNFSASPDSFLGLETSCPNSDPYDNFTLTCTATKPTIVLPELVLTWTHNGTIETGTVVTTGTDTAVTTVTNTLNFSNTMASDTGTHRCVARINIPDSTTITTSEESTAVLRRTCYCACTLHVLHVIILYACNSGRIKWTKFGLKLPITRKFAFGDNLIPQS